MELMPLKEFRKGVGIQDESRKVGPELHTHSFVPMKIYCLSSPPPNDWRMELGCECGAFKFIKAFDVDGNLT